MQFWPINGKGIAQKTVHDCITCFRQRPTGVDQLMGNLPSERVTPSAPFLNSGEDFCGPFKIKFKNQRKGIFLKVYVAILVCLATKPIHLEAVTDLTTEAFIAALKRLCTRRGRISALMSDNATNFKGAAAELNRFIKLICNKNETLSNYFASEAIQWKFIPPHSPNAGGLTATASSDVVQTGRPIFDDFFQHLWPYIGNTTANIVFQMVKRLWLIRIDQ
ncbi:integrase catalytic domain-containing protein [Trichonephila clavipes]|nr:integrase catalytic domain-containing protein [Trichonephila clavipes]